MLHKRAVLVGYSGHALVVGDTALSLGLDLCFYTDKKENKTNSFKLKYIGFEGDKNYNYWKEDYNYILGIGDNKIREKTAQILIDNKQRILTIQDASSEISKYARIGEGCFIARQVSINAFAHIKDYCILNTGCIIEHECHIQKAAHIGPGAVLAGNVNIGQQTFVGANAVIKQGVKIGDNVTVGAGAVVVEDIPYHTIVVGNPARPINK